MNLICIAAFIAVCGAAKLDRTYLPPASAKSAGGSAGSLQTPFAGNSLNEGSNGLPKGSVTNEFQGVVVDAAAAGTRASGEGETGLGASRISYGSTDSRVGDAAFRGTAAAFRPFPSGQNFGGQGQTSNGQGQNFNRQSGQQNFNAQIQSSNGQGQAYNGQGQNFNGQSQNYNGQSQNFNTQNQNFEGPSGQNSKGQSQNFNGLLGQDSDGQSGLEFNEQSQNVEGADGQTTSTQVQSSAQGFNQFNRGPSAQASAQNFQANRGTSQPARAQAASDRAASTLRFENDVGSESYHYAFETDNGISAEENGVATNGVQAQGGFSYTGDDGKVYTVTYTADEGGYQPKGDHLPTPPPIPDEILKALAKNAQDEASGLVDDGSYDAQKYNAGSDYASDSANVGHNDRQTPSFGKRPADASASGTFINQNNQPFVAGLNEQAAQEDGSSDSEDASGNIGSSATSDRFGQFSQTTRNPSASAAFGTSNNFGQAAQPARTPTINGLGSRKEYLPPVAGSNQNGRPQRPTANTASTFPAFNGMTQATASESYSQSESDKGSQSSPTFGRPNSNRLEVLAQSSTAENLSGNNEFQSSSNVNNFAQTEQSSENLAQTIGSKKEFLPPTFGQNSRPQGLRPQRPTQVADVSVTSSFNAISQSSENFESNEDRQQFSAPTTFATGSNAQVTQQYNTYQQRPQSFNNRVSQNRFPSTQRGQDENKGTSDKSEESSNGQVSSGFASFNQVPTSQPSTELTTPFESNEQEQGSAASSSASFNGFASQSNTRPGFPKGSQSSGQSSLESNRRPVNRFSSQTSASAENQSAGQFYRPSVSGTQPTEQNADAQFSPSTTRPSFGQAQGVDQSYYYRQPPKPFNTPLGSRFPGAPSGQFNRITQQSGQSISKFPGAAQPNFAQISFQTQNQFNRGSTRYPELPTLAPTSPTGSSEYPERTFSSQNNGITQASISPFQVQNQGSTKYPRPPTLPSAPTTLASQFNGITQATASSFTSASSASYAPFEQTSFNQAKPSAQSSGSLTQQSEYNQGEITQGESQEIPTQQYNGEIYEYSKPPQGLPSPAQKEPVAPPQRGQSPSARPQFGSSQTINGQEINDQKPTRPSFEARPQFGSQPARPQFGFNPQGSTSFGAQNQPSQDSKPQAQQFAQSQESQGSTSFGSQGRPNKCCQSLDAKLDSIRKTSQNNAATSQNQPGLQAISQSSNAGGFVQGQLDEQFSGPTSQPQSQTFAGRGESFGGPRKPPSFDQQTGYHY